MINKIKLLTAAIAATLAISACQGAETKNTASNQAANKPTTNTAPSSSIAPVATDTSTTSTATPTDAYKAAYAARKNKDVNALKKLMSKDILEFFTAIGGMGGKKQTVDELLMEMCEKPQAPTAEARNEKINGSTATIEYLDEKGGWSTMDFVKEDGGWKLTIAKPEKGDVEIESDPKGKSNK